MTFQIKLMLAMFAVLIITLACTTILGPDMPEGDTPDLNNAEEPVTETAPTIASLKVCPLITDHIMEIATSSGDDLGKELLEEEVYLVTYKVSGNELSDPKYEDASSDLQDEQGDTFAHQKVWDYFLALIPPDRRETVAEYSIFTDGQGGTLAAVTQTQSDPHLWSLDVDIADISNTYDLTYTLVHEFGHLLTLGPDQVPPSLAVFNNPEDDNVYLNEVSACPQYFPGEGCANSDSYINAYFDQFWGDIHEEWNTINLEDDEDLYYERLDDFYKKYQDQFVTDYAVTNPEEDMAESWAFFVLGPKPTGKTIAEEKALFFYQYPELVELRLQILNNLCESFPK